jgi:predicted RNase H-like nuclease (RuvC/YqgF family)
MDELLEILDNRAEFAEYDERESVADMVRQVFGDDVEITYYD